MDRTGAVEEGALDWVTRHFRRVLALATLAMLGASWPLWVRSGTFPRVPFVAGFPEFGGNASWALFAGLLATVTFGAWGKLWRVALGLSLLLLVVLVLQDQHRFQPWAYQYFMIGLLLACLPNAGGLRYARWWFAALYLHSGLSKLDVSFCDELGLVFLTTLVKPLGLVPAAWPPPWRAVAVLVLPLGEIGVAVLLCVPRLRRWGLIGALILHAALLILILGPLGLGHSPIVLVWNAAMMAEVWVLFGSDLAVSPAACEQEGDLASPGWRSAVVLGRGGPAPGRALGFL